MYLAVIALNGFGIYDNESSYENNIEWMNKPQVVEFDDELEAKEYALNLYNDRQDDYDNKCHDYPFQIKMNWFNFKSHIWKRNMAEI